MKFWYSFLALILAVMVLAGCAPRMARISPQRAESLSAVNASDIYFDDDLDIDSLDLAIERSIHYYDGAGHNNVYRLSGRLVSASQMKESLLKFRQIIQDGSSPADKKKQISRNFDVYRATGQDGYGSVLFTGYYVPLLEGSRTRTEKYKYPLYRTPPDLLAGKTSRNETKIDRGSNGESAPNYRRKEIDAGGILQGKNLEIAWVADPIELFFLHIQGSGEIRLENGTVLTVSTAKTNGRPYRSVPSYLLEKGIISGRDASNRNIKRFLKEKNEKNLYEILGYNERYIFFKFVEKPTGSLDEPVTSGRTIATDPDVFPAGALAFIRLRKPVFDQQGNLTSQRIFFSRFVLNQDKGAAIKGHGRVDLFCGFGETADSVASSLKEKGELYFLIKK
jgi:membrane-bound lytic murein transglycosylase A